MRKGSGRFWITDKFLREYARRLNVYEQLVYIALCCHANREGTTFVGCRKIAEELGISKDTVNKYIKSLEASHWIRRLDKKTGRASHFKVYSVPYEDCKVSYRLGPKEYNKELMKEESITNNKSFKGTNRILEELEKSYPILYEQCNK